MKRIKKENYKNEGIFIDLDVNYIPYLKIIYETEKYLDKKKKYFFYCKNRVKSKEVVMALTVKGYDVTQVI